MGRGDKRTRRGKIFKGSYGNTRKHETEVVKKRSPAAAQPAAVKKAPATKKAK